MPSPQLTHTSRRRPQGGGPGKKNTRQEAITTHKQADTRSVDLPMTPERNNTGQEASTIYKQIDTRSVDPPRTPGKEQEQKKLRQEATTMYKQTKESSMEPKVTSESTEGPTPWESQLGWFYLGHGVWAQEDRQPETCNTGESPQQAPEWLEHWLNNNDKDIQKHNKVRKQGYPNRWGAKIPVESKWNLELFSELLQEYPDREVVDWIRYRWPTVRLPTLLQPGHSTKNHKGATDFPKHLNKYM